MKLNLSSIGNIAEDFMIDACTIRRDPQGTSDDTWDANSGTYTALVGDMDVLYDDGPCMIYMSGGNTEDTRGSVPGSMGNFVVEIPMSAAFDPHELDVIEVTAMHPEGDQTLIGKTFVVQSVSKGSYEVTIRMQASRFAARPR